MKISDQNYLEFVVEFLEGIPKIQSIREKMKKLNLVKFRKDKAETGTKYLQNTCLVEDLYPNLQRALKIQQLESKQCN